MKRRTVIQMLGALGTAPLLSASGLVSASQGTVPVSVESLPPLEGSMTLYLGRGEGGLYEKVMEAIRKRNPGLDLKVRRGPTVALANTLVAEAKAGVQRADLFWAVDSGSLGMVAKSGLAQTVPTTIKQQLRTGFRYDQWTPITGRVRTLPFNTDRVSPEQMPDSIMAMADSDLSIGWAPAYGSFQSFVTAMRLLEGEEATAHWLEKINGKAQTYAGELGVVMAVSRGEVDVGFANHYYTLRLKSGKPDAPVSLAFTNGDAGSLLNASGAMVLSDNPVASGFVRYLLTQEVQSFLASEAYEIPMVRGVPTPEGLPPLSQIQPPAMDLTKLADVRPTLNLMRKVGVL